MAQYIGDGATFNFNANPSDWPTLSCSQANLLALSNSDLQFDSDRSLRFLNNGQLNFQNDGQISAQGALSFSTGPALTERLRITADGNIGIGTNTPGVKVANTAPILEVRGGTTSLQQEDWIDPDLPLKNNWQPYEHGHISAQYFKDSQGIVHLRGMIAGGSFGDKDNEEDNYLIFTLPPGYRPEYRQVHIVSVAPPTTCGRIDILRNGQVVCIIGASQWVSLDSISFRAI